MNEFIASAALMKRSAPMSLVEVGALTFGLGPFPYSPTHYRRPLRQHLYAQMTRLARRITTRRTCAVSDKTTDNSRKSSSWTNLMKQFTV
jgi:hypothetical protein